MSVSPMTMAVMPTVTMAGIIVNTHVSINLSIIHSYVSLTIVIVTVQYFVENDYTSNACKHVSSISCIGRC